MEGGAVKKATRRRGNALDEAILEAAWAELLDRGYAGFTMEAVATRAGTSRPVLSRRWSTGAELVIAAISHYFKKNPICVPDLGSVRDELALLLQKISDRGMVAVVRVLFGMRDYFVETNTSLTDLRNELRKPLGGSQIVDEIFRRGVQRGEIDPTKLTKRIASLPFDLLRHEALMTHKPIPKAVIAEILDSIFLPLVSCRRNVIRDSLDLLRD
jgi:AcrR family transcriptional regulator